MPLCYPIINIHTADPYPPMPLPFWDSFTLKMKALWLFKTMLCTYQTTTWFLNPKKSRWLKTSVLEGQHYMNADYIIPKTTINK
jgi:hypothetical protein